MSYQVKIKAKGAGLSWRRHVDQIHARLNPETVVPVVTPAGSDKSTEGSIPRSNDPAAKVSNSPT